ALAVGLDVRLQSGELLPLEEREQLGGRVELELGAVVGFGGVLLAGLGLVRFRRRGLGPRRRDVMGARGLVVAGLDLALGSFLVGHTTFFLPPAAALGNGDIVCEETLSPDQFVAIVFVSAGLEPQEGLDRKGPIIWRGPAYRRTKKLENQKCRA